MPVSKERFAQGLTADEFQARMTRNQERYEANLAAAAAIITDDDRRAFGARPLSIVAIAEDWCTDVIHFLPVVVALTREVPSINLRIFLRDENPDLIDQYLNQGKYRSIPVFVLYDADWNELGHFIERPAAMTEAMARESRRFAMEHPELPGINRSYENMPEETRNAVRANSSRWRWETMDQWNRVFLDELRAIVEGNASAEAAGE
ncbi:thioredoxin family protein [Sphaerobacter sp.]|uniref:thioredoxin family protein n=1 Tax=Sphaerobacter sp. TaxID=2099654 RepID=UPI001E10EDEF|nr:thioredoxin family protein [Sphaerobacter sp.]MBX5444734.1 thioredoxin family protein [Sphaerobacter sp.]